MYTNLKMYPVKSCDAYICEYYYFKLFIKIHYLYPIVCCAHLVVTINPTMCEESEAIFYPLCSEVKN